MFCDKCGADNESDSTHCVKCGAELTNPENAADAQVSSSSGPKELPPEIKGFNSGAFFLTWIWCLAHKLWFYAVLSFVMVWLYIILAVFTPIFRAPNMNDLQAFCCGLTILFLWLILKLHLGHKGNELAWKSRKFDSVAQFKDTQKAWNTASSVALFIFICLFLLLVWFPSGFIRSRDNARYTSCLEALNSIKTAEEMYLTDNGKYSIQPQGRELTMYMIPGCNEADGSDCVGISGKGEVKERIERSCAEGSFRITGTAKDYEVRGVARDRNNCKICVTARGSAPARYDRDSCQAFTCP